MCRKNRVYILCGLMSVFMTAPASATVFDFTPENLGVTESSAYNSVGMVVDDIAVDITAYTIDNDGNGVIFSRSQISDPETGVYVSNSNNLGVVGSIGEVLNMDGGSQGDTRDLDEGLLFSFNQVVSLNYMNFDWFGDNDDFNLTVDGIQVLTDFGVGSSSLLASQVEFEVDEYNFSNVVGQNFLFWADSNSDSFRIDRMQVSAVPEPAPILLFGLGLAILAFVRRKSKV